jgi:hypothetical protein
MIARVIGHCIKLVRIITYLCYLRDFSWAVHLASLDVPPHGSRLSLRSRELYLHEFDVRLSWDKHAFFLAGLQLAKSLKYIARARFHIDADDRLVCSVKGVTAIVQSLEELWILEEIFVIGVYNMVDNLTDIKPMIVWDIGMNVALSSLYFATKDDVVVVGHEPLDKTYQLALDNLMLNPELFKKVETFNYGIGGYDRTETVDYCPEYKGSVGIRGLVGDVERRRSVLGIDEHNTTFTKEDLIMRDWRLWQR